MTSTIVFVIGRIKIIIFFWELSFRKSLFVYKPFIKVFIKKLVYVKSSWKVSKSASETVLRMISTTQQFEFFRKLLGICRETSVMDTIFNKV